MTMKSFRGKIPALFVACIIGAGLWARISLAQPEPTAADMAHARELLNQGLRQREMGDASGALEKLRAAHSLVRTPILALELGRTCLQLGKLVEAREIFLSVARMRVRSEETSRSTTAREQSARMADETRARLASVTIRVIGGVSRTVTVTIDGEVMPAEALGTTRLVDPGGHEVVAHEADGATTEVHVDLHDGEAREVDLTIGARKPAAAVSSTAPTAMPSAMGTGSADSANPAKGSSRWSPLVYVGIGLASTGVIVGTVTGLLSVSKESLINEACGGGLRCPHSVHDDLQNARTVADVSTVSFAVAGVGAIVGVLGLVLPASRETAAPKASWFMPWIAPSGAGIQGTF